jgi:hypothetical protein
LYLQTHIVVRCHQGSQIHIFFDNFKSFVTKCHALPNAANRFRHHRRICICLLNIVAFVCSFDRRTIDSSKTLKISGDNTSPCPSLCRILKVFRTIVLNFSATRHSLQCCCRKTYYTGHITPLVQLSGSVSLAKASWITSSSTSIISAAIES